MKQETLLISITEAKYYIEQEKFSKAATLIKNILKAHPQEEEALFMAGWLHFKEKRYIKAIEFVNAAAKIDRSQIKYHNFLAHLYSDTTQSELAIKFAEQDIQHHPSNHNSHNVLAINLAKLGQYNQAVLHIIRAFELAPSTTYLNNFYCCVTHNAKIKNAQELYDKLKEHKVPLYFRVLSLCQFISLVFESQADLLAKRKALNEEIDDLLACAQIATEAAPFNIDQLVSITADLPNHYLPYQALNDKDITAKIYQIYSLVFPDLNYISPYIQHHPPLAPLNRKTKLGVISYNLNHQTIYSCCGKIFVELGKLGDFDITIFSPAARFPKQTDELISANLKLVELPESLALSRTLIASHQMDVITYTDIGSDLRIYSLAMARLAPIQCCIPGFPGTTGIKTIDYLFASKKLEGPTPQQYYNEQLVLFDNMIGYIDQPQLPHFNLTKEKLGFDSHTVIYLCPMLLLKVLPEFDDIIIAILSHSQDSVILFIEDRYDPSIGINLRKRFAQSLPAQLQYRIKFLPHCKGQDAFLNVINVADVVLDTTYFAGASTSIYILFAGTPMVTLPGDMFISMVTAGYYRTIGVTDLIAKNVEHYLELALKLGNDPQFRKQMKEKILLNVHKLADSNDQQIQEYRDFYSSLYDPRHGS